MGAPLQINGLPSASIILYTQEAPRSPAGEPQEASARSQEAAARPQGGLQETLGLDKNYKSIEHEIGEATGANFSWILIYVSILYNIILYSIIFHSQRGALLEPGGRGRGR